MKRIVSLLISIYLLPNIFTSPGEVSLPGDLLRQVPYGLKLWRAAAVWT